MTRTQLSWIPLFTGCLFVTISTANAEDLILCTGEAATVLRAEPKLDGLSVGVIGPKVCGVKMRKSEKERREGDGLWLYLSAPGVGSGWALLEKALIADWEPDPAHPTLALYRAQRAEVPSNLSGIKTAQMGYDAAFDEYMTPIPAWPRAMEDLTPEKVDWGGGNPGFQKLGWSPNGNVRGTYWVESHPTEGFIAYGAIDADGDGIPAVYMATKRQNTHLLTEPDIF